MVKQDCLESSEVLLSQTQNESPWSGMVINGESKRSQYCRLIRISIPPHLKKGPAH